MLRDSLKIILVAHEHKLTSTLTESFSNSKLRCSINAFNSLSKAEANLVKKAYDLVILDLNFPKQKPSLVYTRILDNTNNSAIIILTDSPKSLLKKKIVDVSRCTIQSKNELTLNSLLYSIDLSIEQKRITDHNKNDLDKYKGLVEQSNDAVYILYDDHFQLVNKKFEELFGYKKSELLNNNFNYLKLVSPDYHNVLSDRKKQFQKCDDIPRIYEFTAIHKNGSHIECEVSVTYSNYANGVATQGVIRDITNRKKHEKQLIMQSAALNFAANGIMITDTSANILWVNKAMEHLTGYKKDELISKNSRTFNSGEQLDEFYENLWDTITSGKLWKSEIINKRKDGSKYYEHMKISSITDNDGNITNYIAIKEEITKKIKKNKEIERNNKRLEILNKLNTFQWKNEKDIILYCLESLNIITDSEMSFLQLINENKNGISSIFVYVQDRRKLIHSQHANEPLNYKLIWTKCVEEKEPNLFNEIISTNNKRIPKQFRDVVKRFISIPLFRNSETVAVAGVCNKELDYSETNVKELSVIANEVWKILENRTTLNELKKSEERFRRLYENATIGLYQIAPSGKLLLANTRFYEIFGFNSIEEIPKNFLKNNKIFEQESRKRFLNILREEGVIYSYEQNINRQDGTKLVIRESARKIVTKHGELQYFEGTVEEITEQKNAESRLLLAKEKAERSDRLKSEFLTQISHEIRTPLNALLSFSNLLKIDLDSNVVEEYIEYFESAERSGNRILRTIDLILDMSQIQTGLYSINYEKFDIVTQTVIPIVADFKRIAAKKGLKLNFKFDFETKIIYADKIAVGKILDNLVDNAVKFTKKGFIDISLKQNRSGHLVIKISDTGIGISNEFKSEIFNLFSQEEQGYTRKYDGNGLGLALVKNLADMNKILISCNTFKGRGTSFTLDFGQ